MKESTKANETIDVASSEATDDNTQIISTDIKTVAGVVVTPDTESSDDRDASHKAGGTEDNLELRRMKFKDRIKAKQERLKANTEGMTNWEKFKYYVYYYKWHVVFGA